MQGSARLGAGLFCCPAPLSSGLEVCVALRRCPGFRCPNLVPVGKRCPIHEAEHEGKRGTSTERGYGISHQRERAKWEARLRRGPLPCARCGRLIFADDVWDLGHDDEDRSMYNGPECSSCNRSAGGKLASRR